MFSEIMVSCSGWRRVRNLVQVPTEFGQVSSDVWQVGKRGSRNLKKQNNFKNSGGRVGYLGKTKLYIFRIKRSFTGPGGVVRGLDSV